MPNHELLPPMATELPGEELASATISRENERGITSQFEAAVREIRDAFRDIFAPDAGANSRLHIAVTIENLEDSDEGPSRGRTE